MSSSLRLGALHDALLDPGNPEKARLAAEELAVYQRPRPASWLEIVFQLLSGAGWFLVAVYFWQHRGGC